MWQWTASPFDTFNSLLSGNRMDGFQKRRLQRAWLYCTGFNPLFVLLLVQTFVPFSQENLAFTTRAGSWNQNRLSGSRQSSEGHISSIQNLKIQQAELLVPGCKRLSTDDFHRQLLLSIKLIPSILLTSKDLNLCSKSYWNGLTAQKNKSISF